MRRQEMERIVFSAMTGRLRGWVFRFTKAEDKRHLFVCIAGHMTRPMPNE